MAWALAWVAWAAWALACFHWPKITGRCTAVAGCSSFAGNSMVGYSSFVIPMCVIIAVEVLRKDRGVAIVKSST